MKTKIPLDAVFGALPNYATGTVYPNVTCAIPLDLTSHSKKDISYNPFFSINSFNDIDGLDNADNLYELLHMKASGASEFSDKISINTTNLMNLTSLDGLCGVDYLQLYDSGVMSLSSIANSPSAKTASSIQIRVRRPAIIRAISNRVVDETNRFDFTGIHDIDFHVNTRSRDLVISFCNLDRYGVSCKNASHLFLLIRKLILN